MSIDEQPMNVYWSGKRTETNNNFKTNYKGSVATKNNLPNLGNKTGDMYNVAESGENFIWNGNSWDSLSGDTLKTLNWQKTEKAGAVTCWPVGGTELLPTVDFMFAETGPASGDKGPENPSTITGVSSVKVTRCGKNLFRFPFHGSSGTTNGITFTVNSDATVTASGTATSSASFYVTYNSTLHLDPQQTYVMSGTPSGGGNSTYYMQIQGSSSTETGAGEIISGISNPQWVRIRIASGVTVSNLVFKPQLELGSTATAFEPYDGADYTINLGDTYYGGSVNFATGVLEVTHSGMTLNGDTYLSTGIFDEQSDVYGVGFYPDRERLMTLSGSSDAACSILPVAVGTGAKNYPCAYLANNTMGIRLQFSKTSLGLGDGVEAGTVRTAVHALLAQHPGFIVWPVATPYTVQLTPQQILSLAQADKYTPRLNTVYTDAQAVQVGYAKSPIRSEYELTQAIIATEGGE